jgi:riboflavin kinase/FMN adenylyltransferase
MEIARLETPSPLGWPAPAVTVGNFDGVHRGHQALAAAVVRKARSFGGTGVVLTFDPHPSSILSPERAPSALMTLAQKTEALAALGVDRTVLLGTLGARAVVVGENFRFGRERAGDLGALRGFGEALGFGVEGVPPVLHEGAPISSTRIREALARGAVDAAWAMLGRPFFVEGLVVAGAGRGRTLGVRTANLRVANETIPRAGVYAGRCLVPGGRTASAVVNVGSRPTFGGGPTTVEAHLLDFDADLYGESLRLLFHARLREERAFPSAPALVAQIESDIAEARRVLENR